jgi:hypothetical protein
LIRDHGDAVEADLAFRQIDLRDLYRKGSGMTLRRLHVLVRALPPDAVLWAVIREAEAKANKPSVDKIRERQAYYAERAAMTETQGLEHDMSIAGHEDDCPICKQAEEAE